MADLADQIDPNSCYFINIDPNFDQSHLFCGDHTLYTKSDADEQMIICLAYRQTHKLTGFSLGLPADDSCPQTVKVFINKTSLGFSEASDETPVMVINIEKPKGPTTLKIALPPTKFQRVDSIALFIEDNYGEECSVLHSLHVFGTPVMGTNVAEIKNC